MTNLRLAALLLAALPLAACTSTDAPHDATRTETTDGAEARLPEVRYYVVADT